MREAVIHGVAIVIAGLFIAQAIGRIADQMQFGRSRYAVATVGRSVAVLDMHSGQLQTFRRVPGSHVLTYVGTDSRNLHERHQQQWQRTLRQQRKK